MERVVYLVPAPDMDERSIEAIQIEGYRIIPLALAPLRHDTKLEDYVQNLCAQIRQENPVVLIGACYGGPLALEMSKRIDVEKLVIVAGIKNRRELTPGWKILFRTYLMIPPWFEWALGVPLAFTINRVLRIPVKIPRIWRKSGQNKFIARHLLRFEGNPDLAKVVHIHGSRDGIFPIRTIKGVDVVIDSGHFMIDRSRRATLPAIAEAIHS